jgi:hypothetical protein
MQAQKKLQIEMLKSKVVILQILFPGFQIAACSGIFAEIISIGYTNFYKQPG